MFSRRRRLSVAVLLLVAAASGPRLAAQETNTSAPSTTAVGPPQLKDFQLKGQRTTPPVQTQPVQPQPQPQPPRTTQPATTVPPVTAPRTTAPAQRRPGPATQPAQARTPATTAPQTQAPAATILAPAPQAVPVPAPVTPLPVPSPAPVAPPQAASAFSSSWLWIGGGLLLALLAFLGLRRFLAMRAEARKQAQREARAAERIAAAEAKALAEAQAVAEAEAARAAMEAMPRARIELGFVPDRAIATENETIVHYDLILRNVGDLPARNIRIDGSMFNANAQKEIDSFLKGPIHDESGSPQVHVPPGGELKLGSAIAMPKENVRGIKVQGHDIFVPIVAIIVAYDWGPVGEGGGSGRTSRSWLVGREPQTPSDKMGAFRLDAGPRVYRSVGQRPTELAHVA